MSDVGIVGFATYVPTLRLSRESIVAANGWRNAGLRSYARGSRAICNWDEDVVTMAVAAARDAIVVDKRSELGLLVLASTTAPFDDRSNAAIVCEALGASARIGILDSAGSQRAATTGLLRAFENVAVTRSRALVIASEKKRTAVGGVAEVTSGDGAAAVLVGPGEGVARLLGTATSTVDFVDHYRGHGRDFDYAWEERWVRDEGYLKIVPPVLRSVFDRTGLPAEAIDHFCMPCTIPRVRETLAAKVGIAGDAVRDSVTQSFGDTGSAHPLLLLTAALEVAKPGERILVASFGQGCDAFLFEATPALVDWSARRRSVATALEQGRQETNYNRYLAFNDLVRLDKGLRSELDKQTPLSTLYRNREMLMHLVGGRCTDCGTVQFPRSRVCANPECVAHDTQVPHSLAGALGRVLSWSADYQTYTIDPPAYYGMIAFEAGGKLMADISDAWDGVRVGMTVRMALRVKDHDTMRGFTRYFWKAIPVPDGLDAARGLE